MQMGWCSVLGWAASLSLAFKAPEKIDDWIPDGNHSTDRNCLVCRGILTCRKKKRRTWKIKTTAIYKKIWICKISIKQKKQFMWFCRLKADKLQRNRSDKDGKNKDQVEGAISETQTPVFEMGPKPVDDTFTLNSQSGCEKSLTMLETVCQNNDYTPRLECFPYRGSIICW
jgi:hypothetical protein